MTTLTLTRLTLIPLAAVVSIALVPSPARAVAPKLPGVPGRLVVRDEAKLFSPNAVEGASGLLRGAYFRNRLTVTVETYPQLPAERAEAAADAWSDPDRRDLYLQAWAAERLAASKEQGVFIL